MWQHAALSSHSIALPLRRTAPAARRAPRVVASAFEKAKTTDGGVGGSRDFDMKDLSKTRKAAEKEAGAHTRPLLSST
jgi:hypothetical protein